MTFLTPLVDLNLAVWYGIGIHTYLRKKNLADFNLAVLTHTAKPPNLIPRQIFRLYSIMCISAIHLDTGYLVIAVSLLLKASLSLYHSVERALLPHNTNHITSCCPLTCGCMGLDHHTRTHLGEGGKVKREGGREVEEGREREREREREEGRG